MEITEAFLTFGSRKEELKKPRPLHGEGEEVLSYLAYSVVTHPIPLPSHHTHTHIQPSLQQQSHFSSSRCFRMAKTESNRGGKDLLWPQTKHLIHFTFQVSDVSHLHGKVREGCWMSPCHSKHRCCWWWQFPDRWRYNVSVETTAIRWWRREQGSKISVVYTPMLRFGLNRALWLQRVSDK